MKTKYIFLTFITVLLFCASCEDMLKVKPSDVAYDQTSINPRDIIVDESTAQSAVLGMYSSLQGDNYYGQYMLVWGDLAADVLEHTGTFPSNSEVDFNDVQTSNVTIDGLWTNIYATISRANNIIYAIPAVDNLDTYLQDLYLAEAHFVRGLAYFDLVKSFGGVPIINNPILSMDDITRPERNTVDEVYEQVETDLQASMDYFTSYANDFGDDFYTEGRANFYAAMALKARVHLYQEEWEQAMNYADSVIQFSPFVLEPNYADIFDYRKPTSQEIIFMVDFNSQDNNNLAFWFFNFPDGRHEYAPTKQLQLAYPIDDTTRYNYNIMEMDDGTLVATKYRDVSSGTDDVIILRLTEMYFIRAEAALNGASYPDGTTTALQDINTIRDRAAIRSLEKISLPLLLQEKMMEYAFEGHRWFDLTRVGRAEFFISTVESQNQYLWPIPQDERDVNPNLEQNPGY
ncbi:MAG: RagB/SusD family nutrient uptake outer membrane protein [Bacteroidales bacterium]